MIFFLSISSWYKNMGNNKKKSLPNSFEANLTSVRSLKH